MHHQARGGRGTVPLPDAVANYGDSAPLSLVQHSDLVLGLLDPHGPDGLERNDLRCLSVEAVGIEQHSLHRVSPILQGFSRTEGTLTTQA